MRIKFEERPQVIEETEVISSDLDALYDDYVMYTKLIADAEKKRKQIKVKIADMFTEDKKDTFGNYWLQSVNGNFKKEAKRKITINEVFAPHILKRLGIFDKIVSYEPVYDVEMIKNYISDGTIDDDDVKKIFKTEITYAIRTTGKSKTQAEEEEKN